MPKGYIIVRMTVTDPDTYQAYAAMASEAMRKYGCKPLVRGGRSEALEGEAGRATSCWNSNPTTLRGPSHLLARIPSREGHAPTGRHRGGRAGRGGGLRRRPEPLRNQAARGARS